MREAAVRKKAVTLAPAPRLLQRRHVGGGRGDSGLAPPVVHEALRGPGRPLDAGVRSFFEPRFGRDFSGVRVHTDDAAARSADAVSARAYAVGRDVVFAKGQYDPNCGQGRELLAHELAHTVQQQDTPLGGADLRISDPSSAAEREGDRAASAVMSGQHVKLAPAAPMLARQPAPPPKAPSPRDVLIKELDALIAAGTWPEIRKRVYPAHSAAGIQAAKDRHAKKAPDLTGLGKLSRLEHFSKGMHDVQAKWPKLTTEDKRLKAIADVADDELVSANVPPFEHVLKAAMTPRGQFIPADWEYHVNETLIASASLSNDEAADLANVTLHESRHAEQQFLAARYEAFTTKKPDAATIAASGGIPEKIAGIAIARKFNAKTEAAVVSLGKDMFQAMVTDQATHQAETQDALDKITDLGVKNSEAQTALANLKAADTPANMKDAGDKRDALKKAIADVETAYGAYRAIPYEDDAHRVGDAEEQAFRGWP
jgi:hypothetical protein